MLKTDEKKVIPSAGGGAAADEREGEGTGDAGAAGEGAVSTVDEVLGGGTSEEAAVPLEG
jgi:hypothetical protein